MSENNLYLECKNFLDNFNSYANYNAIRDALLKISKIDYENNKCDHPLLIEFVEDERFGNMGRVPVSSKILLNSLRIDTIKKLKIDCFADEHIERIYNFYNNYKTKKKHSKYEKCLYNFIDRYIAIGAEGYFTQMGSYKNTKYELLETILHEDRHVFQKLLSSRLYGEADLNLINPLDVFVAVFGQIYTALKESNIPFDYERVNYIYPIEFDARYYAMAKMDIVRQKYYNQDSNFKHAIVNSNIIPLDTNVNQLCEQIFVDYLNLYSVYDGNLEHDNQKVHNYIMASKNEIIKELILRYETMLNIVKANKFKKCGMEDVSEN